MNGIVIGVSPVLTHLGPFTLRWYSMFFVLAIFAGCWLGLREAARKGLDVEQVQSLAIWAVVGGLLAVLWRLRPVFKTDGLLFLTYVAIYGAGRFLLTFYRIEKIWFWGLQEAQVFALLALLVAVPLLLWRARVGLPGRVAPLAQEPSA